MSIDISQEMICSMRTSKCRNAQSWSVEIKTWCRPQRAMDQIFLVNYFQLLTICMTRKTPKGPPFQHTNICKSFRIWNIQLIKSQSCCCLSIFEHIHNFCEWMTASLKRKTFCFLWYEPLHLKGHNAFV